MIIYKATNTISGKAYIGKTVKPLNQRKAAHKYEAEKQNKNYKFHRAIRKYGFAAFEWEVLSAANDEKDLMEKECYFIQLHDTVKQGYNTTDGGEGVSGLKHSVETLQKISKSRTGLALGESSPNGKLTEAEVIQIKELSIQGVAQRKIAAQFEVSKGTIGSIQRGETWSQVEVPGFEPKTRSNGFVQGATNTRATVSEDTVREIKKALAEGVLKQNEIARKHAVTEQYVSQIKHGKAWSHVLT